MKHFLILFVLFILVIIFGIYFFQDTNTQPTQITWQPKEVKKQILKEEPKASDKIALYSDGATIKNKGFHNELIYKPSIHSSELHFENSLVKNNYPLNTEDDEDPELPIANINVAYMIKNETTKLNVSN